MRLMMMEGGESFSMSRCECMDGGTSHGAAALRGDRIPPTVTTVRRPSPTVGFGTGIFFSLRCTYELSSPLPVAACAYSPGRASLYITKLSTMLFEKRSDWKREGYPKGHRKKRRRKAGPFPRRRSISSPFRSVYYSRRLHRAGTCTDEKFMIRSKSFTDPIER